MTFVAVVELRVDAEFLEHQHTTDTEHILLFDTVFPVAAIKLVGDLTVKFAVHVEVGIHQVEVHATYVHTPNVAVNDSAGERYLKDHRATVFVHHLFQRKLIEVLGFVVGNLLTVNRQGLGEISVTVKETYGSHVDTAVRCFLDIVAGEYTKTAGVNFQCVAQTIFH